MQVGARAAESLQPGETTGFHSLSGATLRATLPQRDNCDAGSTDQAIAYGLMPSQASPLKMSRLSPSANQMDAWFGSTWERIEVHMALSKVLDCQKKMTG